MQKPDIVPPTPPPEDPVMYDLRLVNHVLRFGLVGLLFLWALPGIAAKVVGVLVLTIGTLTTARIIRARRRELEDAELRVRDSKRDGRITEEQVAAMGRLTPVYPDREKV